MAKLVKILLVGVFLVGSYSLVHAGIATSKHDFRTTQPGAVAISSGGITGEDQICRTCHVPHKKLTNWTVSAWDWSQELLWTQTTRASWNLTKIWSYTMLWYSQWKSADTYGPTTPFDYADLDQGSKRCMTCHDGGTFWVWSGAPTAQKAVSFLATKTTWEITDLTDVHPVGVKYGIGGADWRSQAYAEGKGVNFSLNSKDGAKDWVGCGSCHDPHNTKVSEPHFLDVSISGSDLCLACHNK